VLMFKDQLYAIWAQKTPGKQSMFSLILTNVSSLFDTWSSLFDTWKNLDTPQRSALCTHAANPHMSLIAQQA